MENGQHDKIFPMGFGRVKRLLENGGHDGATTWRSGEQLTTVPLGGWEGEGEEGKCRDDHISPHLAREWQSRRALDPTRLLVETHRIILTRLECAGLGEQGVGLSALSLDRSAGVLTGQIQKACDTRQRPADTLACLALEAAPRLPFGQSQLTPGALTSTPQVLPSLPPGVHPHQQHPEPTCPSLMSPPPTPWPQPSHPGGSSDPSWCPSSASPEAVPTVCPTRELLPRSAILPGRPVISTHLKLSASPLTAPTNRLPHNLTHRRSRPMGSPVCVFSRRGRASPASGREAGVLSLSLDRLADRPMTSFVTRLQGWEVEGRPQPPGT